MDFSKLFNMIDNRKKKLEEIADVQDENLVFYENFINNNSFNISGLLNMDYTDLIVVYLYSFSKELDVNGIKELISKCDFIMKNDFDFMDELFKLLFLLNNGDELKDVSQNQIASYVKRKISKNIDFNLVKKLYDIYDRSFERIIAIVSVIDEMKLDYDYNSMKTDFFYEFLGVSNNE